MSRTVVSMVLACLLLGGLPVGVQAQQLDEVEIFTEAGDDIETQDGASSQRYAKSDLVGLYLIEGVDDITFRIQVRTVDPDDQVTFVERGYMECYFQLGYETQTFQIEEEDEEDEDNDNSGAVEAIPQYRIALDHDDGRLSGYLDRYDPAAERFVQVGRFSDEHLDVDAATDSFVVSVPREHLQDFNGAQVGPGLPLHDFIVQSYGGAFGTAYDVMPDDEVPTGEYIPQLGIEQTGHLRLSSPAPVRASNGEATTYVYDVLLQSNGDFIDDVELVVVGAPDNWQVKLPADSVRIDNETNIHLPVLVTTPFGHEHGSFVAFILEAHSSRDPSAVGRIEIGVRYTTIPQPAGHHSMLWLHSSETPVNTAQEGVNTVAGGGNGREGGPYAYFNAADSFGDDRDMEIDVPPDSTYTQGGCDEEAPSCVIYGWSIYLEPTLQIGLDFDLNGTGTLSFPIEVPIALEDAVLEGRLYYERAEGADRNELDDDDYDPEDYEDYEYIEEGIDDSTIILGEFAPTEPESATNGGTITFETTFTPSEASDFLLYEPNGASVWMDIYVRALGSEAIFAEGAKQPVLVPGGEMLLPLKEYHDPVDDLYNQLTDVDIKMESEQEQYVNSAETVLFEVRIENTGVVNDQFHLAINGTNSEWATILGDTSFSVRSHESRRVVVAVYAPFDTVQGDNADLVLEAVSESDDNARALVRLYAEVDNLVDHEDKSHLVPITHDELTRTPFGAWLAPLALLGMALFIRRK